jgi:hypothetical protein
VIFEGRPLDEQQIPARLFDAAFEPQRPEPRHRSDDPLRPPERFLERGFAVRYDIKAGVLEDHPGILPPPGTCHPPSVPSTVKTVQGWPLDTAKKVEVVTGRLGSITLYELGEPVAVLVVARGAVSLKMIRHEIECVTEFAKRHPQGWCYLGDVRRVRLLNPWNVIALRRIGRLPGVGARVIVVPAFARRLAPFAIGELTTSVTDALARCGTAR